jgi:hypothetical protein
MMNMNLRHTFGGKITSNEQEEAYVIGWDIIEDEVTRMQAASWEHQLKGNQIYADKLMEGANMHIYLFYYAFFIRNWLDRRGLIDDRCSATQVEERFKIKCVEEKILCMSADHNTDYNSAWKSLLELFGISRQTSGCETDCCLGIGEMTINDRDDCTAFIIGACDENETELTGDYEDCAYDDAHFHGEGDVACDYNNSLCKD